MSGFLCLILCWWEPSIVWHYSNGLFILYSTVFHLCTHHNPFILSTADRYLGYFQFGAVLNNALCLFLNVAFGIHVHISAEYTVRSEIAGSQDMYMFSLRWDCQIVFQSGYTNWTYLHSHQWYVNVPNMPHLCRPLVLSIFFILALLTIIFNKFSVISQS